MVRDVQLIHCNEYEEIVEIESYAEESGALISLKISKPGQLRPFQSLRNQLETEGWQIELAGTTRLGSTGIEANSYVARRPRT